MEIGSGDLLADEMLSWTKVIMHSEKLLVSQENIFKKYIKVQQES